MLLLVSNLNIPADLINLRKMRSPATHKQRGLAMQTFEAFIALVMKGKTLDQLRKEDITLDLLSYLFSRHENMTKSGAAVNYILQVKESLAKKFETDIFDKYSNEYSKIWGEVTDMFDKENLCR